MNEEGRYWERFGQRRLSRRRVIRGAALGGAGLAAAAVIGCGEEEKKPAAPAAPAATAAPAASPGATPVAAAKPVKKGGRLVTFHNREEPIFNINKRVIVGSRESSSLAYTQLTRFKRFPNRGPLDYDWEPHLAQQVQQPDPLTVILKLHPNAKYAPRPPLDGRKVTSEDIKASWGMFVAENTNARAQARVVESVQTPDPATVTFKLKQPLVPFIFYFNHDSAFFPIAKEFVDKADSLNTSKGGELGPFMLKEYKIGQSILWEKNPNYFDAEHVYVDELEVLILLDPTTHTSGFRAKKIHLNWFWELPQADVNSMAKDLPDATIQHWSRPAILAYSMDVANPAFKDVRVRRAMSMAVDRNKLLEWNSQGSGRLGVWASHLIYLPKWWLDPRDKNAEYGEHGKWFKFDPAEAKKLLQAAGWDSSKTWPFKFTPGFGPVAAGAAEITARNWADVGIKTQLEAVDIVSYYGSVYIGKLKDAVAALGYGTTLEPDEFFVNKWTNNPSSPVGGKEEVLANDKTLQGLIDKQAGETNFEARRKIVNDIEKYLASQMYIVPSVSPVLSKGHQSFVKNVSLMETTSASYFENAWLDL